MRITEEGDEMGKKIGFLNETASIHGSTPFTVRHINH